ncbi:MAG: class I SAM-dependent methyltransferase [Candidatus Hydrogenedentota bacterium]
MPITDTVWKSEEVASKYLQGVRGAIPGALLQLEVMMRLLGTGEHTIDSFLDLGCGDGILGQTILAEHPEAQGVFVDFSEPMIDAALKRLGTDSKHAFHAIDYGQAGWIDSLSAPFDCIVSGFSIHHQPDERKKEIYQELFDALAPGGWFINMEHVLSATKTGETAFLQHLVDNMFALEKESGGTRSRAEILHAMENNEDSQANILARVDVQCEWLSAIGFQEVDCYFKIYELAIFGGVKPTQ